jgi:hypothetical protein
VSARVRHEQRFIEVRARGDAESRAIVRALEWGTNLRHAEVFPLDVSITEGRMMAWDPRTVFMLNFLDRGLPDSGIRILNLTSARFEASFTQRGFSRQPMVRSVALQGQHVIDSKAACELLVEGRALTELSLDVLFRPQPDREVILPIRISLLPDHVGVLTGFGAYSPEVAVELHREINKRLRSSLSRTVFADEGLESLADQIIRHARSAEPIRRVDIFAPPEGWRSSDEESEDVAE